MKYLLAIFLSFIISIAGFTQTVNDRDKIKFNPNPKFFEEFLNFSSTEKGKTRVDVFIQVPYSEVQFIKAEGGFRSKYNLTVSVFDKDKENLLMEKSWNENIFAKEFDQTISKANFNLSLRSFNLEPDEYMVRTAFEDVDSRKEYASENVVKVREFKEDLELSDIMLISKQTIVDGNSKIIPNVSRNVAAKKDGIPFFFEVYSNAKRDINIKFSILENTNLRLYTEFQNKQIDSGKTQIFHTINKDDLGLGNYVLEVEIEDGVNDLTASVSKTFLSRWMGVPSSIKDLDKAIAQLLYIATSSELDELEEIKSKDEKIKKFLEFWKKKDPDPQSEENPVFDEYYRRVAFANENFSHYVEGWRTDRGMVYIILGPPNNIDRHPFEYDSKPYEVWEYYELNKSFVFLDETGFGDYRLITPLYGDFFRYRN